MRPAEVANIVGLFGRKTSPQMKHRGGGRGINNHPVALNEISGRRTVAGITHQDTFFLATRKRSGS